MNLRWRILSAALGVQIAISAITQAFPALVPFAKADLGLTRAQAGLFATVLSVGMFAALLPAGWAVDHFGERAVLLVGGVLTGVFALIATLGGSFLELVPLLVLVGIAASTPTPAGSTAIMAAFPVHGRGFVMSLRQTGIPIGGAIAAGLLPPIAARAGWRLAVVSAAVLALVAAAVAFLLLRGAAAADRPRSDEWPGRGMREVMTRDATLTGVAGIFLTIGQFALASYIALYLFETWHISAVAASGFLVAANLAGTLGRLSWGVISDRFFSGRRSAPLIVVAGVAAVGCLTLAWVPGGTPLWVVLLVVLAFGFAVVGWNGVWVALLSEIAPAGKRGRSVAYGMMLGQIGIVGGPFSFGLVVDRTGSYRIAWSGVAVCLLLAAALCGLVRERRHVANVAVPEGEVRSEAAIDALESPAG